MYPIISCGKIYKVAKRKFLGVAESIYKENCRHAKRRGKCSILPF